MNQLEKRIIEISYKHKLSHIGSCLTAVSIIDEIFEKKLPGDKFVLSSGHAGLALYVVIEKYFNISAESIFNKCGVHPDRIYSPDCIDCSTGSLGQGLPIALGMALADRGKNIYCLISDGECSEGSVWEALCIREKYKVTNLKVYINFNGYGAYDETNINMIKALPGVIIRQTSFNFEFLKGQDAHYHVLTGEEYETAIR